MVERGDILGSYELLEELGVGGGGSVFRARHVLLGRSVAIKVMNEDFIHEQQLISRFFHEARIVNEIRHPNVIDIVDFLDLYDPRRVAYVMELLHGRPLSRVVGQGAVSGKQAANAALQIASVLEAVHARRVIHRDLKPDNVFVLAPMDTDWSAVPSIKVLDFGVAKLDSEEVSHRTATGITVGTPVYMAPEQIVAAPVSPATDVYALGEILYELLAGQRLFRGSHTEVLTQKISANPSVSFEFPQLADSRAVEGLIRRSIAMAPEERPPLSDFVEVLGYLARGETPPARGYSSPIGRAGRSSATPADGSTLNGRPNPDPFAGFPSAAPIPRPRASVERAFDGQTPTPSQMDVGPPPARSPALYVAGGLMVAAGAALVIALALRESAAPQPLPVPVEARAPTPPSPSPSPAAPADVSVRLTSDPEGATVIDAATQAQLGKTPLAITLAAGAPRQVQLSAAGFITQPVQLDAEHSHLLVVLNPGENTAAPKVTKPRAAVAAPRPKPAAETTPSPAATAKPLRKDETTTW